MYNISNLFSVPVYQSTDPHEVTDDELKFVRSLDVRPPVVDVNGKPFVSPSEDFQVLDSPEFSSIKKYSREHLDTYIYDVIKISREIEFYFTESWVNYMDKGGSHPPHTHPNSIVSGVFFIHGDPCPIHFLKNDNFPFSGFSLNVTEKNNVNANTYEFYNYPGVLLLFPSTTPHTVFENQSDYVRVSLSFNTFIKGKISDQVSTALYL